MMFSFAGVVKTLSENNLSLWTFADFEGNNNGSDDFDSTSNNDTCIAGDHAAADIKIDNLKSSNSRDRWVKGAEDRLSDDSADSATRSIEEDSNIAYSKPPLSKPHGVLSSSEDAFNLSSIPSSYGHVDIDGGLFAEEGKDVHHISSSKKKKKKKNRSRANSSTSATSAGTGGGGKRVAWGHVEQVCFSRDMSFDRVPSDGSYPLGLGAEVSRDSYSMDEMASIQQADLITRAIDLGMTLERMSIQNEDGTTSLSPLESRQFDYKSGARNPLFSRMSEEDRVVILANLKLEHSGEDEAYKMSDYNKEVKVIRNSRIETGCNCKPTKVDKLSVVKMKAELVSMGSDTRDVEKMSKSDLTTMLKEKLVNCQLCVDSNCHCVQMGIPCSADSCGCLKNGSNRLVQACGNSYGQRVYDSSIVNLYRSQYLSESEAIKMRERMGRRSSF